MKHIVDIDWDTGGYENEECVHYLPEEWNVPDDVPDEDIADFLSDTWGFCVKSYVEG